MKPSEFSDWKLLARINRDSPTLMQVGTGLFIGAILTSLVLVVKALFLRMWLQSIIAFGFLILSLFAYGKFLSWMIRISIYCRDRKKL